MADTVKLYSADPVAAWRDGDTDVIAQLAGLELRATGLKPPRTATGR